MLLPHQPRVRDSAAAFERLHGLPIEDLALCPASQEAALSGRGSLCPGGTILEASSLWDRLHAVSATTKAATTKHVHANQGCFQTPPLEPTASSLTSLYALLVNDSGYVFHLGAFVALHFFGAPTAAAAAVPAVRAAVLQQQGFSSRKSAAVLQQSCSDFAA
ncbi:hypothetical protein cyc_04414 [Cyclospora cayetanensis]|uniref:Uncharacterized protein n=1 Tax=Cyclospora cayetanensis TaxID=88456 RepID=A0A1D3CY98_9EIME|nr:hypothetical protein cyc_04414 [Cyclospora cayetanensis]